jgi:RNA polymerase sigma-70 factor (ECF subfamily)
MQALQASLGRLPERVAQVFIMREIDEAPSREICERLSITESNLWVMLHRARMALRQDLEETYFQGEGGRRV